MYSVSREYWFSAAHRIEGHPKCGRLHGHNYQVIVTIYGASLPKDGMLIDYGELDKVCKPIIDEMDHRYIVSQSNHEAHDVYEKPALLAGHAYPLNAPASTAEYIAEFLWNEIWTALHAETKCRCTREELMVKVSETPKSMASYEYD